MFKKSESIIIENPDAISILNNFDAADLLEPFFLQPRTLSEAAKLRDIKMSRYYYWIKKFLKTGLLIIAYEKKRSGSSIKYYSTPAKNIIIKVDERSLSLKEYYEDASSYYNAAISQNIVAALGNLGTDLGILLSSDEQEVLCLRIVSLPNNKPAKIAQLALLEPSAPAAFTTWDSFQLSFQDAKEFQHRLANLVEEFKAKVTLGQSYYKVQLAIVPDP